MLERVITNIIADDFHSVYGFQLVLLCTTVVLIKLE